MIKQAIRATAEYVAGAPKPDSREFRREEMNPIAVEAMHVKNVRQWAGKLITLQGLRQDLAIGHPIGRRLVGRPFPVDEPSFETIDEELYGIDRQIALELAQADWTSERNKRLADVVASKMSGLRSLVEPMYAVTDFNAGTDQLSNAVPVVKPTIKERSLLDQLASGFGMAEYIAPKDR